MSTLAEVLELEALVLRQIEWFGAEEDFFAEFRNRLQALGAIICSEYGLTSKEVAKLSPETELGSEAESKFNELKKWLEIQEQSLAMSA